MDLTKILPGTKKDVRLAPLTTFGIGGFARWYYRAGNEAELIKAQTAAREAKLPVCLIAGGSNVVLGHKKFPGLVIHYLAPRPKFSQSEEGIVVAPAAAPLAALIKFAGREGLAGLESLAGIPGTVGGAIVGNAGAYGQSISDHLVRVRIADERSRIRWISKKTCRFKYRDSIFKHRPWLVLGAEFTLTPGDPKALAKKSRETIKIREKKYKPGLPCPGSFFKNVLAKEVSARGLALIPSEKIIHGKIPAGYLLEEVGAKGLRTGNLEIAAFHGNLLINCGGATQAEVKKLSALLKRRVYKKFGIRLEEEVRYLL